MILQLFSKKTEIGNVANYIIIMTPLKKFSMYNVGNYDEGFHPQDYVKHHKHKIGARETNIVI